MFILLIVVARREVLRLLDLSEGVPGVGGERRRVRRVDFVCLVSLKMQECPLLLIGISCRTRVTVLALRFV
jgi:hypothetical protein